jgi:mono/diheme cytochrome c family protein
MFGLLLTFIAGPACAQSPRPDSSTVTYSHGIASLLQQKCVQCHRPSGGAPFNLLTYADAKQWGDQILDVTQSRYMPPWLPASGLHRPQPADAFKGDRRLSDTDLETIRRWMDAGMPEGATIPAMHPTANDDRTTPLKRTEKADLELTPGQTIHVPASGPDIFLTVPLPVTTDREHFIRAIAIEASDAQAAHSIFIGVDKKAELRRLHPEVEGSGLAGMELSVKQTEDFAPGGHLLLWTPDTPMLVAKDPWALPVGSQLILTAHIKTTGKAEDLMLHVLLYYAKGSRGSSHVLLHLDRDEGLQIAAGDKQCEVEAQATLKRPMILTSIYPRAHYAARSLEAFAVLPDGSRRSLLTIDKWDVDWASIYRFVKPIALPKGAVIHMSYAYDNSSSNPHNPSDPPRKIVAGHSPKDEVAELWMETAR